MKSLDIPFLISTASSTETEEVGASLAGLLLDGTKKLPRFVALFGDLGAGKTAFVRGLASVIAPGAKIKSPTFAIVHEYRGKLPLFHFDMYRIKDADELYAVGFYDYFSRGGIIVTEWSENIVSSLPDEYIKITITKHNAGENLRTISGEIVGLSPAQPSERPI